MARIKEKTKENLGNVVWTWVVVGVLSAVVITGIVLSIIYFVNLNKGDNGEKTFDEVYESESTKFITFDDLNSLLGNEENHDFDFALGYGEAIYVFVYSPDTEAQKDQDVKYMNEDMKLSDFIKKVIEDKPENFYILNVLSEDNKDKTSPISDLATDKPTLLMIGLGANSQGHAGIVIPEKFEDMELSSGKVTDPKEIINILERVRNN